jgi:uncharacterized membrane protein YphA (DoxX/SURF4 family)
MNIDKSSLPILLIRLFAGTTMFFAGFEKAIYTSWGGHTTGWSATNSLLNGGGGFLHDWFVSIARTSWVSPLVYWGEIFIGLAILLGLTLRIAAFFGIVENGLFWANGFYPLRGTPPKPDGGVFGIGWANGPLELNAALIMMYIILILVGGIALKYSIAGYLHNKFEIVRKNKILQLLIN